MININILFEWWWVLDSDKNQEMHCEIQAGGYQLWIQTYNPSALPRVGWLPLSPTFQYCQTKAPGAFVCNCSCVDWPRYVSCSAIARIQFRLPDGSSFTNQFPSEARLEEARQFAAQVNWCFVFSAMCWLQLGVASTSCWSGWNCHQLLFFLFIWSGFW